MASNTTTIDHQVEQSSMSLTSAPRRPLTAPLSVSQLKSKAFEVDVSINPLIACCAPVLTAATEIRQQTTPPDLAKLQASFCHEIKVFEEKAHKKQYRSPIVLAARYFLCSFIDEIVLSTPWGAASQWQEISLLKTFQRESWGGEKFFMILERSCQDAINHIELMELGYLTICLGYEGKYQKPGFERKELAQIKDNLYYLIREVRGDLSQQLFIGQSEKSNKPTVKKRKLPLLWIAAGVTIVGLLGMYIPYYLHLNHLAAPIEQNLQVIAQNNLTDTGDSRG